MEAENLTLKDLLFIERSLSSHVSVGEMAELHVGPSEKYGKPVVDKMLKDIEFNKRLVELP